jgi:hypothetical protein
MDILIQMVQMYGHYLMLVIQDRLKLKGSNAMRLYLKIDLFISIFYQCQIKIINFKIIKKC